MMALLLPGTGNLGAYEGSFFFLFFFEVGWAVLSVLINVAKKPFSDRTQGVRRGGGLEGGGG